MRLSAKIAGLLLLAFWHEPENAEVLTLMIDKEINAAYEKGLLDGVDMAAKVVEQAAQMGLARARPS